MPADLERRLKKLLTDARCQFVRHGKGSHEIWFSPITNRHFPIPAGLASRHTANAILKQAGLPKAF